MHRPQAHCHYLPIDYLVDSAVSNNCDYRENNMHYVICGQEYGNHSRYFKQEGFNIGNELLMRLRIKLGEPRAKVSQATGFVGLRSAGINRDFHT